MLLRRGFPAVAVWLSSFSRPTLSLPTSGFAGALSPADTTLAERLTSIFEQRPHSQAIPLSESAIASLGLAEAAVLSQAAYCKSVRDLYWTCGKACSSYPDMYIQWSAGTSQKVPYTYVARSTTLQAVVVAHAGTKFDSLDSWAADLNVNLIPINEKLEKLDTDDENSRILVHEGFYNVWEELYDAVHKQVRMALRETGYSTVLVTGHSQGAAIAQIEAVALRNDLESRVRVENVGFGSPRLGNKRWADLVGRTLGNSQMHVANYDDAVVQVPPALLTDYHHAENEVWINHETKKTYLCRGQENDECAASIMLAGLSAHSGPYFGTDITEDDCEVEDNS